MNTNEEQQRVIAYIQREEAQGYNVESIRQALVEHGYRSQYVDVLIDKAQRPADVQGPKAGEPSGQAQKASGQVQPAQRASHSSVSYHLGFLSDDLIHLSMPSLEQTLLVIIPVAIGALGLGLYMMGLHVEHIDWALIKFSVFLVASTLSAKAIVLYLRKKGAKDLNQDAIFEKAMRLGFIIFLLSLAMEGALLMGFIVLGIFVLAYALTQKAHLSAWKALEATSLFAFISLGITYAIIIVAAVAVGLVTAKGLL